ncbi:MAG: hypothetical protein DMF05_06570 [Verrucomicrobia bacterium]|nr:MAG: hypothetical protein DMF05_06570 [Verrucomicrobiota bacterium]
MPVTSRADLPVVHAKNRSADARREAQPCWHFCVYFNYGRKEDLRGSHCNQSCTSEAQTPYFGFLV